VASLMGSEMQCRVPNPPPDLCFQATSRRFATVTRKCRLVGSNVVVVFVAESIFFPLALGHWFILQRHSTG